MGEDEWLWLEEIDSPEAARWVAERNERTRAVLAADAEFTRLTAVFRRVLDADDRIPYPGWRGDGHYYDFWKDADHARGIWRRTTAEQYRLPDPAWDVLLDLDAVAAAEQESWIWRGVTIRRTDYRRALVSLSRGGTDAVVVREFDLERREFVADGFDLPAAKTTVSWIDDDTVYVTTDEGPGSLTSSGYPRVARRWRRGTPLTEAEVVFRAEVDDVLVYATHDPSRDHPRDFVGRALDFFHDENFLRLPDGELVPIPVPSDAGWSVHREWLAIRPRSEWEVAGHRHPAGTLLVTRFDDFLAGGRELTELFRPDPRSSLAGYHWTRNHLLLETLTDVRSRLEVLTPEPTGWRRDPLPVGSELDQRWVVATDADRGDEYAVATSGFLEPDTLRLGRVGGPLEVVKRELAHFDPGDHTVQQFFATSDDGTRVPYFVVGDPAAAPAPTILTGYGGFEISMTPGYLGVTGAGWLAAGGSYVVANIRGGGEYGPAWHRAAIRERRPRAYEDFAAVARDLVARGVTTPSQLGITGGSNGGLLMGVMLTRYPELFGAVVAKVPLMDMRRYHRLLAGASWMAEYGDPDKPADWEFLREYSPYHQVLPDRPYPPVLLLTSTRDDRVHPGHARKLAARLAAFGYDVSYYENVEGGHGGAADNAQAAYLSALSVRFFRSRLVPAGSSNSR